MQDMSSRRLETRLSLSSSIQISMSDDMPSIAAVHSSSDRPQALSSALQLTAARPTTPKASARPPSRGRIERRRSIDLIPPRLLLSNPRVISEGRAKRTERKRSMELVPPKELLVPITNVLNQQPPLRLKQMLTHSASLFGPNVYRTNRHRQRQRSTTKSRQHRNHSRATVCISDYDEAPASDRQWYDSSTSVVQDQASAPGSRDSTKAAPSDAPPPAAARTLASLPSRILYRLASSVSTATTASSKTEPVKQSKWQCTIL